MNASVAAPPEPRPTTTPPTPRHRARRWWITVGAVLLAFVVTIAFAGAWYFSGQIQHDMLDATNHPVTYTLTATPIGHGAVRITAPDGTTLPDGLLGSDIYGIRSADSSWVLGPTLSSGTGWVVRRLLPDAGRRYWAAGAVNGVAPATDAALSEPTKVVAYRELWLTPTDIGRPFQAVSVTSSVGTFHDWFVPGATAEGSTWVVLVHGKGGTKAEGLRALTAIAPLNLPALLIGYRNDADGPTTQPERYTYGVQDWPDVAASVQYALNQGASDVVLVGFSYGGALVASFLTHSDLASHVSGVVLDSPMLSAQQTVRYGAEQRTLPLLGTSIPSSLVWASMQMARLRYGSDWYRADYLSDSSWLTVPLLLYQGTADAKIPLSTGRQLASAHPDLVTYVVTPGAEHVGSWNTDPQRYDDALRTFLQTTLSCQPVGSSVSCRAS